MAYNSHAAINWCMAVRHGDFHLKTLCCTALRPPLCILGEQCRYSTLEFSDCWASLSTPKVVHRRYCKQTGVVSRFSHYVPFSNCHRQYELKNPDFSVSAVPTTLVISQETDLTKHSVRVWRYASTSLIWRRGCCERNDFCRPLCTCRAAARLLHMPNDSSSSEALRRRS